MVTADEQTPTQPTKVQTAQPKPARPARPARPDNSVLPPDPTAVQEAQHKADVAKAKLAKKNSVSVSKDDSDNVLGVATEHFNIARSDHYGIPVVNISKRGYVGPAQLTVSDDELDELKDALGRFE